MENEEYTTIQIYRKDLAAITSMCRKNENLRDKLHEIINNVKNKIRAKGSSSELPEPIILGGDD